MQRRSWKHFMHDRPSLASGSYGRHPRFFATYVVAIVVATSSCSNDDLSARNAVGSDSSSNTPSSPQPNELVLEHDFGLLPLKETLRHRFSIENSSDVAWSVLRIHEGCRCFVLAGFPDRIDPGSQEEFEVSYRTGSVNHDDDRSVLVQFNEAEAPLLRVRITSRVRDEMAFVPPSVHLPQVGKGDGAEANFEIQNFGGTPWESIDVLSPDEFLTVQSTLVKEGNTPGEPRQVWRAVVTVDASNLDVGQQRTVLQVKAAGKDAIVREYVVNLSVASAVDAIPGQFFFGTVSPEEVATRKVMIRFAPQSVPATHESIVLDHDGGTALTFSWGEMKDNYWELIGTLRAEQSSSYFERKLTVTFPGESLPALHLPVRAMVSSLESGQ
jgi:uncharacterized protein DUF1573